MLLMSGSEQQRRGRGKMFDLQHITASELAGYGVGSLLLCATLSAPKIDTFISASQRRRGTLFGKRIGDSISYYSINRVIINRFFLQKDMVLIAAASNNHHPTASLGMCKKCGDLRLIACTKCKGSGLIKEGSTFSVNQSKIRSFSCANCRAIGHFRCPECFKLPQN